ncbi:hypothetical protein Pla100_61690 [Neorhodopirellula pilleata]|uniref:Uncharacterized protein n=1 Tax=Neorhodopirellula pilleata TaxID=2714738 RepID=A0A5C5ZFH1_9BACT|nr:hypothetical protein Pla100_61690 [Neorhodopirellula pilleata]
MDLRYKTLPIDQLIDVPSKLKPERSAIVAGLLDDALNRMAADGWRFCSTYRGAGQTLFIFEFLPSSSNNATE